MFGMFRRDLLRMDAESGKLYGNPEIEELKKKVAELSARAVDLAGREVVRYVQLDPKNEGDPARDYVGGDASYHEYVSSLLDDSRFQWLIYKRQMQMVDIMNATPRGDPESAEMRMRAAYRMDGLQMLIDDMVAMKRAHLISKMPVKEEGLS